jgi:hypothetical protein
MSGFSIACSSGPYYYIVYHDRFIITDLSVLFHLKHIGKIYMQLIAENKQTNKQTNKMNNRGNT